MKEENQEPTDVSEDQSNDELDVSKLLEMAKLFSALMANDKEEDEVNSKDENKDEVKVNQDTETNAKSEPNNIFQLLEMAKLFSKLMGNNTVQNSPSQIPGTAPIVYPSSAILFDETLHTPQMKVIKAAIPYLKLHHQRVLGVFVKFLEFKKAVDLYKHNNSPLSIKSLEENPNWKIDMLNSIRPHCTEEKQCMVDMVMKVIDIEELMKKMHSLKYTQADNPQANIQQSNQRQALIQALSPMLNEKQKQMLDLLTTFMGPA
ncbi:MAG: hypothetical protein PWP07_1153 [Epulopiscium sp.]|jgi:hypothetical protein|uniref:Uncharacterized protein n=1 Tax=Defluviitalea raffinosedens TaxID=1450156 RepID=A0A7C8LL97_9FIRM|nr:hypothetical protein [Defluviitalea raffinosedens]MBZ4668008.1 hypothetical protein [Defluviitaleaceae bacterium]MDK2787928.1 hypothetical protein [Candidatus Epulonipiscium sp.]KAE9635427.1 hypothetical protein GND95_04575 [Defluviitalea raffinosedens]MBM7684331.1 hypothetical protein [Defluviitalea raffinosedens]HHW67607.1 hypothetical protein [Candidatus Epulonipiscium sp.]